MENKGCGAEKSAENNCSTEKTGACGDKKKCCPVTVLKGTLVGGIVLFGYFMAARTVLPLHTKVTLPSDMTQYSINDFLFCLLAAALLTKLLRKCAACGCCPVLFSLIVGLIAGSFSYLPNIIWLHAPLQASLVGLADDVIAITLAGAAIGKLVLGSGACTMGKCGDKKAGSCGCSVCKCTGECNCPCCCKKTGGCGDKKGDCGDKKGSCG